MHRLALAAVLLASAGASADPDPARLYAEGGLGTGGAGVGSTDVPFGGPELALAAAGRFTDHLWFRGALTVMVMGLDSSGHLVEPHAGVEWRTHDNPHSAVFLGIDAGWLSGHGANEDGACSISGAFALPRAGIEFGGEHVRFQLTLELLVGYGRSVEAAVQPETSGSMRGGNLDIGLIVR